MKKVVLVILATGFYAVQLAPAASALTVLTGSEAGRYLKDPKTHFLSGGYTYEILGRSHRDAMHGRFSDGVIFNPGGGQFLYPLRKDGEHKIVIDSPSGREEDPVTGDAWRQKLSNALSDDNIYAYVFLDDQKRELAVVYVGRGTQVTGLMNEEGRLEISLMVEGARGARSSGRRRGMM